MFATKIMNTTLIILIMIICIQVSNETLHGSVKQFSSGVTACYPMKLKGASKP